MKRKTLLLSAATTLTVVIIAILAMGKGSTDKTEPSVAENEVKLEKIQQVKPTHPFAFDTVSAIFNGKTLVLSLDDTKVGCNSKELSKRLATLPPLDLLNSIYSNSQDDYILKPEKTLAFSTLLYRKSILKEQDLKALATTPFDKLSPSVLSRVIAYTYYGARTGQSKRILKNLLSTHATTKRILLGFRKDIKEINCLDFLPADTIKFNGVLLFEGKVVAGKIAKKEVPKLMRSKVNIGTRKKPEYGITLNIRNDKRVEKTAYSCEDLLKSFQQRFEAITPEAKAAQTTFYTVFNVLSATATHNLPKKSFVNEKGLNSLSNLPVTMLPVITRKEMTELSKHGGNIADLTKANAAVKIVKAEKEHLHLFYNHAMLFGKNKQTSPEKGMELKLTEVMRGDFNSDGLEDIFLQAQMNAPGNPADFLAFILITLHENETLFKQINIPWK